MAVLLPFGQMPDSHKAVWPSAQCRCLDLASEQKGGKVLTTRAHAPGGIRRAGFKNKAWNSAGGLIFIKKIKIVKV